MLSYMKAAHISRARSRHLLKYPHVAEHNEIAAMAAEIERLHARLRHERATADRDLVIKGDAAFTINQSFADADPEKVLAAFRRDLAKATMNRYTTSIGSVFGDADRGDQSPSDGTTSG